MTVHIWGRLSSLNVRKVVWAAQETGVAFTRSDAGLAFGVVKTPEYLAMNPNGVVPTLVLDGRPQYEAAALAMLLAGVVAFQYYAEAPRLMRIGGMILDVILAAALASLRHSL